MLRLQRSIGPHGTVGAIKLFILVQNAMSEGGYKIRNQAEAHFITFAMVLPMAIGRVDVFTRKDYRDIVLESLKHCQEKKGLLLHAWCIMSNHLHLVASAKDNNLSDILRDFKKFTSKQIIKAINENKQESRREWMLEIFKKAGEINSRNSKYLPIAIGIGDRIINRKKYIAHRLYFRN